jgi:TctA family transporter
VAVAVFRQGLAIAVSALAASGGIASATAAAAAAAIISLALIQLIYDIRCKYSGLIAPVVLLLTACLCVSDGFFYVTVLFTALPNLFSSRMWRSRRRHSPSTKDNLFQPHSSAKKTCSPSWFTVT